MVRSSVEPKLRDIALSDIDHSRNHRIPRPGDAERIEALKISIEACGQLLQPIRVYERGSDQKDPKRKEPYILGFGHRRYRATEALGKKTIKTFVFPPATEAEIAQARAVENLHKQDLTPLEEVLAVADVLEAVKAESSFTGDPYEETATRLGCEITWVKDRDYLHRLTKSVQKFALRSGLPAGHLRELAKVGDPVEQMRLACECIGAPANAFPSDPKDAKLVAWQEQSQEQFFAQLADGKVQRWPLSHLKDQVARVQLSLRQIPWQFDQPVEFGSTKLRKCAGCPHNSETDRTLFGIDEDAANPQGYCLHPSCYNAKHEATDAAKVQITKKIGQRKDQTPTAIRALTPDWLREEPVVGFVKRQLEKAASTKDGDEPRQRQYPVHPGARPFTTHEQALVAFAQAFEAWHMAAMKAVLKGINSDPAYRVAWCVLLGVNGFWQQPDMDIPGVHAYSTEPTTKEPVLVPLPEKLAEAIKIAFKGTRSSWVELLQKEEQIHPDQRAGLAMIHPRVLELLASEVRVKLPAVPEWKAPVVEPLPAATVQAAEEAAA